mgnify:FL=1
MVGQTDRHDTELYMPAMPPMGLSRAIGHWLCNRRRNRAAESLSRLNGHLLDDIGVSRREAGRVSEYQLTRIYTQPLGQIRLVKRAGAPAERHEPRARMPRETRQ